MVNSDSSPEEKSFGEPSGFIKSVSDPNLGSASSPARRDRKIVDEPSGFINICFRSQLGICLPALLGETGNDFHLIFRWEIHFHNFQDEDRKEVYEPSGFINSCFQIPAWDLPPALLGETGKIPI